VDLYTLVDRSHSGVSPSSCLRDAGEKSGEGVIRPHSSKKGCPRKDGKVPGKGREFLRNGASGPKTVPQRGDFL